MYAERIIFMSEEYFIGFQTIILKHYRYLIINIICFLLF